METIRYITSLLTFYLKGEIGQDQNFLNLKKPNTILGLIPLGCKKESVPVTQLSSVESNFKVHTKSFLIGLLLTLLGLACLTKSAAGLILLVIGANKLFTSFEVRLEVKTTAGDVKSIAFIIFQKSKAELAEKQIKQLIANRLDDTNTRQQTDRIVDAINNK